MMNELFEVWVIKAPEFKVRGVAVRRVIEREFQYN
jgi:hypothetical protein